MSRPARRIWVCGLLVPIAATLAVGLVAHAGPIGAAEQRLTSGPGAKQTSINFARNVAAAPGGQIQVVWFDDRSGVNGVYTQRSLDGGRTWGPDVRLSRDGVQSEYPAVARSGRRIYAAWHSFLPSGATVMARRSTDGGATWGPEIQMGAGAHPSISVSGARVRLVWSDRREGEAEVYTRGSANGGSTWEDEVRLSEVPYESWVATVELAGEKSYVAWVDYADGNEEEYLRRSLDGGATWEPAVRLTRDAADSWAPSLAVSGDMVHVAWFDRRDAGVTDLQVESRLDEAMALVGLPASPPPPRDPAVYYLPPFTARVQAKLDAILARAPSWVERGGDAARLQALLHRFQRLYAVWNSSWEIYYKRSADGGRTWGPDVRLTQAPGLSLRPSISVAGRTVSLVWCDSRDGEAQVYAKSSPDGGTSWSADRRLTSASGNPPGDTMHPTLAAGSAPPYVVWMDRRSGNPEIYFGALPRR